MFNDTLKANIDSTSGGIMLSLSEQQKTVLHPVWLRERLKDPAFFDPANHQRLYEQSALPDDLAVLNVEHVSATSLQITFTDETCSFISVSEILEELGWLEDTTAPPPRLAWDATLQDWPIFEWSSLKDPGTLMKMLQAYYANGFCLMEKTPTQKDSLKNLANKFGYLRDTNFGVLFNVITKPRPSDIAYTSRELLAHTDNPYRDPVPSIQFLHCLENTVAGGFSTLVDGLKIMQTLRDESPEQFDILTSTLVKFRYEADAAILQTKAPLIELNQAGDLRRIRLSSRLDYVPPLPVAELSLFYAGRNRLHELANSPDYRISYPFEPGHLLMMDNHRLLHGRTSYDDGEGSRHLQGCYIDHDGPSSLYRMLCRGDNITSVGYDAPD